MKFFWILTLCLVFVDGRDSSMETMPEKYNSFQECSDSRIAKAFKEKYKKDIEKRPIIICEVGSETIYHDIRN